MRIIAFVFFYLFLLVPASANPKDTLPIPPANLRCGDGKQGYGLYWIDKSTDEVQFKVYRTINKIEDFALYSKIKSTSSATEGTDYFCKIDYIPENFYCYAVTSVNKTGESGGSNVAILPKRPEGFTGTADSIVVALNWNIPADSRILMIFIERSQSPTDGFQIMSPIVGQNGVNYFDYSIDKGVDYYYRIRGAFYDSQAKASSYTLPTKTIGPFRISGPARDYDGEINIQGRNYKYKTFGRQTWMTENLAYLPEVYPSSSISISEKRYYVHGYQGSDVSEAIRTDNYKTYGVLYNWSAASDGNAIKSTDSIGVQGICPAGWHLPSNKEWMELNGNLAIAKTSRDSAFRVNANKRSVARGSAQQSDVDLALPEFREFKALPGGYVQGDSNKFLAIGEVENYWSATHRIKSDRGYQSSEAGKGFGYSVRCLKGAALPIVQTGDITEITETTAHPGGIILGDGGATVTDRGVCLNTLESTAPGINKTSCRTDTGVFNCSLTGLASGTIYFIRAYATNIVGTTFGEQKQFITAGEGALPSVFTGDVSDILGNSAAVGGSFTSYGGATITARGICWDTKKKPEISNNKATSVSGLSTFTGYLAGLKTRTTYYVRAYATNSFGTAYGMEKMFTTSEEVQGGFLDFDSRKYVFKNIGAQTWLTENLAYLPAVSPSSDESKDKPIYYVYGYDGTDVDSAKATANYKTYGVLYNWTAATRACPLGWHLPSQSELTTLIDYLTNYGFGYGGGGKSIANSMAATSGWDSFPLPGTVGQEQAGNNRSGFNVLPGGQRIIANTQQANGIGKVGILWSSSAYGREDKYAYSLALIYSNNVVQPYPTDKKHGFSVRCLKDN